MGKEERACLLARVRAICLHVSFDIASPFVERME